LLYRTVKCHGSGQDGQTYELYSYGAKLWYGVGDGNISDSPTFSIAPVHIGRNYSAGAGVVMVVSEAKNGLFARRLSSKLDVSLPAEWLAFCDRHHKACAPPDLPIPKGFRVIDCSAATKLLVAWEDVAHPKHYVTLSYVWGGDEGEAGKSDGGLPGSPPRTIDDAMSLTISLGYRYLWVDRYCIPQDDAMAKHVQLQSMDIIYQHSILTIIAAAGENPHHGLPGVGKTSRTETQASVTIGSWTLASVPFIKDEVLRSKWNSRGWTYQEGLLSRRRLVFTDTQVYFQCNAMHCLESIQAPLEPLHTEDKAQMRRTVAMSRVFPRHAVGEGPFMLSNLINEYLQRSLTFESDILDAFRGVLAAYELKFFSSRRIFVGLPVPVGPATSPLTALVDGLSWDWKTRNGHPQVLETLERRSGFPSWTWVGWKVPAAVRLAYAWRSEACIRAALVDASVEYADGMLLSWAANQRLIFSRDRAGCLPAFLRICGPTLNVHVSPEGQVAVENGIPKADEAARRYSRVGLWRRMVACARRAYTASDAPSALVPFTLLLLGLKCGYVHPVVLLVLYKPEASLHFERVGVVEYWETHFINMYGLGFFRALREWRRTEVRLG
jgi:hypothetical protein